MIGSKDYRREITILSSWRTRCSSRTCAGRRSIRLSQSCSLNTVKPQLRLDAETSSHSSYLDSVFQSVAFTLQRIGFDVTCIAACLALEKKKKRKKGEKKYKKSRKCDSCLQTMCLHFFFFFYFGGNLQNHRCGDDRDFFFPLETVNNRQTIHKYSHVGQSRETGQTIWSVIPLSGLNSAHLWPCVYFLLQPAGSHHSPAVPNSSFKKNNKKKTTLPSVLYSRNWRFTFSPNPNLVPVVFNI